MNKIYSKITSKGMQSLYLNVDGKEYYLFTQSYRRSVKNFYSSPVSVDRGIDFSHSTGKSIRKTMEKLRLFIPYIERENGICVLNKTKKARRPKKTGRKSFDLEEDMAA